MPRQPTPPDLLAIVRAQTPDDASLRAMFGPPADGERIVQIALHALDDNPFQRRTAGMADDDPGLLELSADIKTNGIHQPLVVRPHPDDDAQHGRYQIAAGHRRRLAAHLAGLTAVPCVIRPLTDDQMLDVVFSENYHRTDVNAIDRAQLIQLLVDQGMTQQAIADRLSMSRPAVSNALRLLQLPAEIQADVVTGAITNRQAEALLPLATLPAEAQATLNEYSNLAANLKRARDGHPSDSLRGHVRSAIAAATNLLPDHWLNYTFASAPDIRQTNCTGCPYIRTVSDKTVCAMPPCWHAKSSAWQAIENRQIVDLTGVPILSQNPGTTYDALYDGHRVLGLSQIADGPPSHQCPNLRVRKSYGGGQWTFICHYAADGSKACTCKAKAEKAAKSDGKRTWKTIREQTEATLTPHLLTFPLDALRLLARPYGKWDQREQVIGWDAQLCVSSIIAGLIKVYASYEPEKNTDIARAEMEKLLALAGLRAPWLPPLADELSARLAALSNEIDDYQSPGDGLPTQERMAAILAQLDQIISTAMTRTTGDDLAVIQHQYRNIWPNALALNERVQASHATD